MVEDLEDIHKTTTVISTQVNFSVPKQRWLSVYSIKYPNLLFSILKMRSITEEQGNCLLYVKGQKTKSFFKEFSKDMEPGKYERLVDVPGEIMMNVTFDGPWVINAIRGPQIILLYPIKIQKGTITLELIAPIRKIEEIFRKPIWEKLTLKFNVAKKYCGAPTLNLHQKKILDKAMEFGLFDIPRKKSLTEAVDELEKSGIKMSVSALSENIRRISKKLAECYMNCRDTDEVELDTLTNKNKIE